MDIDFVIPWVDGSDLELRMNKNKYCGASRFYGCEVS